MLQFLPAPFRGVAAIVYVALDTIICAIPIHLLAFTKTLVPVRAWKQRCARNITTIVKGWMWGIVLGLKLLAKIEWDVKGLEGLRRDQWYFVISNHRSWTDIVVLLKIFANKIPFPKFFLKKELIWIPVIGTCWWALDYPFMKRYSRAYLERHPEKRGADLETTRKACERYKDMPVSILNFVEGTRFTEKKHEKQQSPYRNLLKPRAGGFAFALSAMEGKITHLLDVTIVYPQGPIKFWNFLCGRVSRLTVHVKEHLIPPEFLRGDYLEDHAFRERFQAWLGDLWHQKDSLIEELRQEG
ncbi:MAG: acyltransferase [Deltaproteobacteria bacterium]|nr:acyltransferase [Deltaproteobacteria bacterium]